MPTDEGGVPFCRLPLVHASLRPYMAASSISNFDVVYLIQPICQNVRAELHVIWLTAARDLSSTRQKQRPKTTHMACYYGCATGAAKIRWLLLIVSLLGAAGECWWHAAAAAASGLMMLGRLTACHAALTLPAALKTANAFEYALKKTFQLEQIGTCVTGCFWNLACTSHFTLLHATIRVSNFVTHERFAEH